MIWQLNFSFHNLKKNIPLQPENALNALEFILDFQQGKTQRKQQFEKSKETIEYRKYTKFMTLQSSKKNAYGILGADFRARHVRVGIPFQ